MAKVHDFVDYITRRPISELLDPSGLDAIHYTADVYGSLEATQFGAEIVLNHPLKHSDIAICIERNENGVPEECWYELDYACCIQKNVAPCLFYDARNLRSGSDCHAFLNRILHDYYSDEEIGRLLPVFTMCLEGLAGITPGLYQLGIMSSRKQAIRDVSVRIFTLDMTKVGAIRYLQRVGWGGDPAALEKCLTLYEPYARQGLFNIDFDISRNGISLKIGINFYVRKTGKSQEALLDFLVQENLCLPEKKKGILKWIARLPQNDPFLSNDWCHVKLPFSDGCIRTSKAYLRCSHLFYEKAEVFDRPSLMNLELTDRCPLNCPQCYCDLQNSEDMPLETAIRSLRDAGAAGVASVYLSGGETLLYPHLLEVVREASRNCKSISIATSGLGLDQMAFEQLTNAGVTRIYISLNGSTQEINGITRNGFELAIGALSLLRENKYPHTHINWVMHSNNAADFENMIALAEKYDVQELIIMQLKPDSRNRLATLPTYAQLIAVRNCIWKYQKDPPDCGRHPTVNITVEACYSPLKALLEQGFLGNQNRGLHKGCLAGRAVYSVALDGRLTPCRHLTGREWNSAITLGSGESCGQDPAVEEFPSVEEYWQKSEILKRLREDEHNRENPCANCGFLRFCRPCVAMMKGMSGTRKCVIYEALSDNQTY